MTTYSSYVHMYVNLRDFPLVFPQPLLLVAFSSVYIYNCRGLYCTGS